MFTIFWEPYYNAILLVFALALVFYRTRKGDSALFGLALTAAVCEVGFVVTYLAAELLWRVVISGVAGIVGHSLGWSLHRMAHPTTIGLIVEGTTVVGVAVVTTLIWDWIFQKETRADLKLKALYAIPTASAVLVGLLGPRGGIKLFFVSHGWITIFLAFMWWWGRSGFARSTLRRSGLEAALVGIVVVAVVVSFEVLRFGVK